MKAHTLLRKIYSWRIALFALTMIFTSVAIPLSGLTSSTANALTALECYNKFNNKDITYSTLSIPDQAAFNECKAKGCSDVGAGTASGSRKITCVNPSSIPSGSTQAAADAEVKPLQTLVCGPIPASQQNYPTYLACADKVRTIYNSCNSTGGGITGSSQDTDANTGACVYGKLSNPKPSLALVRAAVTQGRADAAGIINTAIQVQQQAEQKAKCEADGGTWANNTCTPKGANANKKTCVIDGLGWLLCPVINLMGHLVDGAYAVVSGLLKVQPLVVTGGTAGIYDAWSIMRNFANVAFVIAFLIIIFSQMTSVGVSNYGIKKMLPRLIIAAILVNVSFWICAIAVDLSNIVGSSINDLFKGVSANLTKPCFDADPTACLGSAWDTGNNIWAKIASGVVVGAFGIGAALYVTLSALLPALVIALFAILTVFLVLTLRQALIILLIVVAPLAFVAYLLPNTESLFKKWRELFQTLLLMYPIIGLIFGASALASTIVMTGAASSGANLAIKVPVQIMGALITIIPLAITPVVMKAAGGLLNRFGGVVNNPNKGPRDRLMKMAQGNKETRQAVANERRTKRAQRFIKSHSDTDGKISRPARIGAWAAGYGTTTGINQEQKTENAKKALAEARQSYVAGRASTPDQSYARAIAGPTGDVEAVIARAQDVVRKEHIENVKRVQGQLNSSGESADSILNRVKKDQQAGGAREMSDAYLGAAMLQIGATGRAKAMQDLNDFIGEVGTERFEIGDDNSARSRTIKDVEQFAADAFENSKVKPKSLASSDIAKMKEGKHDNIVRVAKTDAAGNIMRDADNNIIKIEARDASGKVIKKRRMDIGLTTYFNEGKASKEKLSAMDIDEMDHLSDMDLSGLTAEAKQSLTAAIEGLAGTADPAHPGDPSKRIGEDRLLASKLETRQFKALDKVRAKI